MTTIENPEKEDDMIGARKDESEIGLTIGLGRRKEARRSFQIAHKKNRSVICKTYNKANRLQSLL